MAFRTIRLILDGRWVLLWLVVAGVVFPESLPPKHHHHQLHQQQQHHHHHQDGGAQDGHVSNTTRRDGADDIDADVGDVTQPPVYMPTPCNMTSADPTKRLQVDFTSTIVDNGKVW